MSVYDPPDIQGLPFIFTDSGYSSPDFSNIPFEFSTAFSDSAYLASAIQVMQMYTTTTYSEVKECRTIVVGYGPGGIQTLQLPCEYLGIRDILGVIHGNPYHSDLAALITGEYGFISEDRYLLSAIKSLVQGTLDLQTLLHGWDTSDILSLLQGYDLLDLSSYVSVRQRSTRDLVEAIRVLYSSSSDLSQSLVSFKGYQVPYDLYGQVYAIPPKDLLSYLNIIEIRDLPVDISPQKYKGYSLFESFLRGLHRDTSDLSSFFHGWDTSDIQGFITCAHSSDLPGFIQGSFTESITSVLYPVTPVEILANIHGFATIDIPSAIIGAYGGGHLLGSIYSVAPKVLSSTISAFKEVAAYRSITSYLESYHKHDLWSSIYYIEPVDISSTITARGSYKNLDVLISPKVVFVRQSIFVNILESKVLHSVINSKCRTSSYRDMSYALYAFDKLDLRAIIRPRLTDQDNQKDLTAYVNFGHMVEDTITINTFVSDRYIKIPIDISRISTAYKTDTIQVTFSSDFSNFRNKVNSNKYLSSYIRGMSVHADLVSRITPMRDHKLSGIATKDNYVNRTTVVDLNKGYENWTRDIDIYFNSVASQYLYAQDGNKVYRFDRNEHVILYVEGYVSTSTKVSGSTKGSLRSKYVFNLSNYSTIDDAIRDAIDRAGSLRISDLPTSINSVEGIGNFKYLPGSILPVYSIRTVRSIVSSLVGIKETMTDLPCVIVGEYNKAELISYITGLLYAPPDPLHADFEFTSEDLISIGDGYVDFTLEIEN